MPVVTKSASIEQNELTGHFRTIKYFKRSAKERARMEKDIPIPVFLTLSPETGLSYTPPPPKPRPKKEETVWNSTTINARGEARFTYDVTFRKKLVSTFDHSDKHWGAIAYFCQHCEGRFSWYIHNCPICDSPDSMYPLSELTNLKALWEAQKGMQFVCNGCAHTTLYWYPQCIDCGEIMSIKNKDGIDARYKDLSKTATTTAEEKLLQKWGEDKKRRTNTSARTLVTCKTCEALYDKDAKCPCCTETSDALPSSSSSIVPFNTPEPPLAPM